MPKAAFMHLANALATSLLAVIPYTTDLLDLMCTSFKGLRTLLLEPLIKPLLNNIYTWLTVKQRIAFLCIKKLQTGQPKYQNSITIQHDLQTHSHIYSELYHW